MPLPPVGPEGLSPDSLPPDSQLFDSQPFDSRPFDSRPADSQAFDTQPPDSVAFDSRPFPARAPAAPAREAGPFDPHPPQDLPAYLGGNGARNDAASAAASAQASGGGSAAPGPADAASLAMADQPTIAQVGRYALKRHLGLGGLGQVHEAWDPLLSRTVAIKTLQFEADPRTRNSLDRLFLNEARAVAGLSHPNIVTVYDAGLSPQGVYLAMERLHGLDLRQRLAEGWKPGPAVAAQLVRRVADALAYAHARGVVHCDIKPGNIFIASSDKPKVLDFGIARVAHRRVLPGFEGMVAGSPHFLAPEQLLGKDVDARTDVYSLGVVFYELLSGRRAFAGDSLEQITTAVLTNHPAPAHLIRSGVPEALSAIAARAMARDPEARYATASEMAADIRGWFEQPRTPSASPSSPSRAARTGRGARAGEGRSADADGASAAPAPAHRSPWAIAGLVMAVLGGLGIALALTLGPAHKPAAVQGAGAAMTPSSTTAATDRGAAAAGPGREGELVMSGGVPVMPSAAAGTAAATSTAAAAASAVMPVAPGGATAAASTAPAAATAPTADPTQASAAGSAAQAVPTSPAATSGTGAAANKPAAARGVPAPGARAASGAGAVARDAAARRGAASTTVPSASVPATGTLQLAISPWGQVEVDGNAVGTTPPLTQLTLPSGTHTITVRNADFPPFTTTVQVQADKPAQVRHRFGQ